jgi:hypothetical protein
VLLSRCQEDKSPLVVAEALNSIFDIFAETQHNDLVNSSGMMNKLVKTLGFLRKKLKETDKNPLREDERERFEESEENLNRFLKYKYEQFK